MNEPCIDLTGKLIIKVALGDDIRRILITNEDITYDELVLMMQRVYRGKLNSTDDIVIKYKDEDNDLITIFDSSDLTFAIQCSRILKINLFVNNKPEPLQTDEIKMIKGELKHIRDKCNKLLDKLDERQPQDPTSTTAADSSSGSKDIPKPVMESPRRPSPSPRMPPPTSVAGSKEFDPLSTQRSVDDQQNKVMSSFGISGDTPVATTERPGTPDSVSSIGSSSGQRQAPQQPGGIPSQTGTPVHQGQQPGMYGGSGSKIPPWQSPSPQSQGQPQGQPQVQPGQFPTQQAPGFPPSSSQPQQQQQPHFPGQATTSQPQSYPGAAPAPAPTSQTPNFPGTAPTSQPQSFPGGAPTPSSQPGYGPSSTAQFGSYSQQGGPGQSFPGQPQQPQTQQMPYTQGQQGQPGQQQHQYGYTPQQQPQQPPSGPGSAPGPAPAGGNPYARQGPGYGTGYPRPSANYTQGYQ